jgi:hypothetical protein
MDGLVGRSIGWPTLVATGLERPTDQVTLRRRTRPLQVMHLLYGD